MPAVFQCPVLAAKCDCEARGDGGRGRAGAREASGLRGKEAWPDWGEGKRGPGRGGRAGQGVTIPTPPEPEEQGGYPGSRREREGLTPAGNGQAQALPYQSPAWPRALPGAQCLGHIQPTPARPWLGEPCGHHQTLPRMIPRAGPRPLWAPLPVGQVALLAPVAGTPHTPQISPGASGHYKARARARGETLVSALGGREISPLTLGPKGRKPAAMEARVGPAGGSPHSKTASGSWTRRAGPRPSQSSFTLSGSPCTSSA